jgi:hypothetical protein
VIFEALNHKGVRLDAADLVKNLLFQIMDQQGDYALQRELHEKHWRILDGDAWREEVTTGRIKRVRVDALLAHWLSAQRGEESNPPWNTSSRTSSGGSSHQTPEQWM